MQSLVKSLESKFNDLKIAINKDKGKWPSAQGVNALIVVYPPAEEKAYLKRAREDYGNEHIIDLAELFVEYIDKFGLKDFMNIYQNYRSTSVFVVGFSAK